MNSPQIAQNAPDHPRTPMSALESVPGATGGPDGAKPNGVHAVTGIEALVWIVGIVCATVAVIVIAGAIVNRGRAPEVKARLAPPMRSSDAVTKTYVDRNLS